MHKRRCEKCGTLKPATIEFWNRLPEGYFRGTCRSCMAAHSRAYRLKRRLDDTETRESRPAPDQR